MSIISEDILALFQIPSGIDDQVSVLEDSNSGIDWNLICNYLCPNYRDFQFDYRNCLAVSPKLHLICKQLDELLRNKSIGYDPDFLWTGRHVDNIRSICTKIQSGNPATGVESLAQLLQSTAILEKCLGDIYFTLSKGKVPPHLLKELLVTAEVRHVLSEPFVFVLRLLLGHPQGLNLRNICWHGFPTADLIPGCFLGALIASFSDIGHRIKNKELTLNYRSVEETTERTFNLFKRVDFKLIDQTERLLKMIEIFPYVSPDHLVIWEYILSNRNEKSLYLIFPQIELILRMIYGSLNDVDVTANIDKYYVILDNFLELNTGGKRNAIHEQVDRSIRLVLYDLLIAERGPRIRDKISHGEVKFDQKEIEEILRCLISVTIRFINSFRIECPVSVPTYRSTFYSMEELRTCYVDDNGRFPELFHFQPTKFAPIDIFDRNQRFDERLSKVLIRTLNLLVCGLTAHERIRKFLEEIDSEERNELLLKNLNSTFEEISRESIEKIICLVHHFIVLPLDKDCFTAGKELSTKKFFKCLQRLQKMAENYAKYSQSNQWIRMESNFQELPSLLAKIHHLSNQLFHIDADGYPPTCSYG